MGNSCFRNDRPSGLKPPKNSHESPSILTLKIWREQLGFTTKKQLIAFAYPSTLKHKTFTNVEKDIARTYPASSFFTKNKANVEMFDHVLRKLAVYFPRVGYTQGMNFVVGFLMLSGLNGDETFTMCVKMFTNYDLMCLGLYEPYFPLSRLYCALLWEVIAIRNPKIKQKLSALAIFDDLWIFQWFTTFFIYSIPFEIIPELWTFLFIQKQFAFVRLASAIVLLLWPSIQKCEYDIDFLNLAGQLKKLESFNKMLTVPQILEKANEITNEQIVNLMPKTELETKNKYCAYFSMPENDRKIKYMQIMSDLSEQRQQFLKNPTAYKFQRDEHQISVIDSIEINQAKLMHQSYSFHRTHAPSSPDLLNQKLWKSDLHKLPDHPILEKDINLNQQKQQKTDSHSIQAPTKTANSPSKSSNGPQ